MRILFQPKCSKVFMIKRGGRDSGTVPRFVWYSCYAGESENSACDKHTEQNRSRRMAPMGDLCSWSAGSVLQSKLQRGRLAPWGGGVNTVTGIVAEAVFRSRTHHQRHHFFFFFTLFLYYKILFDTQHGLCWLLDPKSTSGVSLCHSPLPSPHPLPTFSFVITMQKRPFDSCNLTKKEALWILHEYIIYLLLVYLGITG